MREEKVQPETCIVQPAVHRKSKGPVAVIPNKILERKDLALLAIGSAACLRGVYLAIAPFGKLRLDSNASHFRQAERFGRTFIADDFQTRRDADFREVLPFKRGAQAGIADMNDGRRFQ